MLPKLFKNYVYPIAALSGSIIGVGFLSLPYITVQVGVIVMLGYFLAVTALMVFVNLMTVDISLKTPDHKRFPGFVEYHLGTWPKYIALTSTILGSWGVLLIYLVVSQQFLQGFSITGTANFWGVIIFFLIAIIAVFVGISFVARIEFWALCFLGLSFVVIFFKGFFIFHFSRIALFPAAGHDWTIFLLPYGALIFSLGTSFIPAVEEMVRGRKETLKGIIVIGTLIPAIVYGVFTVAVVGITGPGTTQSALLGLAGFLGHKTMLVAFFGAIIILFVAFVTQGTYLKEVLMYDMKMQKYMAWLAACFVPFILFLFFRNNFIFLIAFIGAVFSGVSIIFEELIYLKIGGKKWVAYPVMGIFLAGIIYSIISLIK